MHIPAMRSCLLYSSVLLMLLCTPLSAQSSNTAAVARQESDNSLRRFEIGGEATNMRLSSCLENSNHCPVPQYGLGAGFTVNVNQYLAVDSSLDALPGYDNFRQGGGVPPEGGHASVFLVGLRGEIRARRYGFFVSAKPGLQHWTSVTNGVTTTLSSPYAQPDYGKLTSFALQLGGGTEYSLNSRVHLRFDVNDLLVDYRPNFNSYTPDGTFPCGSRCNSLTNNLQTSAGVYFGLGKPLSFAPPRSGSSPQHAFFDRTNIALISASLLGQASDAITTQRFIKHGDYEADPLFRPLVKYGWSGQISLAVLENSAEIGTMYWLHKMHHHRVERLVPLSLAAIGGAMGYRNDNISYPTP